MSTLQKEIMQRAAIDTCGFFINKIKTDLTYRTEILSDIKLVSKKEIRDDINILRDEINQKLTIPKVYISVKELGEQYCISESQQKGLRGRIKNTLPFYQDGQGGKIRYKVTEIEEWMGQQKIR